MRKQKRWIKLLREVDQRSGASRWRTEHVDVSVVELPICCGATPSPISAADGFVGDLECRKCKSRWLP